MRYEIRGDLVYQIEEVGESTVEQLHDMHYHVVLTASKEQIVANGTDKSVVTATVYDYTGAQTAGEYTSAITFDVNGVQTIKPISAGVATLDVKATAICDLDVKVVNSDLRTGQVTVLCR